jgi:hypothetical protein
MDEEREFGREELLAAWLEWKRWSRAHPDLRTYFEARSRALSGAFGVDLDEAKEGWESRTRWHHDLFLTTAEDYNRVHNPFANYLEEGWESEFSDPHEARIRGAANRLLDAYWGLLLDLLASIWDLGPDRKVTAAALREHGFDPGAPAPDPADYW